MQAIKRRKLAERAAMIGCYFGVHTDTQIIYEDTLGSVRRCHQCGTTKRRADRGPAVFFKIGRGRR